MTTNLDIIKRAMRKIHVLAAGAVPTSVQAGDGMDNLSSLYVEMIGAGSLGRLYDVSATSDATALEWTRIKASSGVEITLPPEITTSLAASFNDYPYFDGPDYGWWPEGFGNLPRSPFNMAPVVITGTNYDVDGDSYTEETYWVYSAYKGAWVKVSDLAQQDAFPLPKHFENGFSAWLAEYMVDDFAGEIGSETKMQARNCRVMLTSRYDSLSPPVAGTFF